MTDEQKAKFCDGYCKHLYDSTFRLKYFEGEIDIPEYSELAENERRIMEKKCEECPLNEV